MLTISSRDLRDLGATSRALISSGKESGDVFLPNGLTGVVESGGTWTDDTSTGLLGGSNNNVFNANGINSGTYPFTYTVSNGVCPDASTTVSVVIKLI